MKGDAPGCLYCAVAGVHKLYGFVAVVDSHGRLRPVSYRVNEGAVFLHVSPLLFLRQLFGRMRAMLAAQAFADREALHLLRHERAVMTEDLHALERKEPAG